MTEARQCLIIDDDEDDQEIFLMCVGRLNGNIKCDVADSAVAALSMLEKDRGYLPHYIFLDVNMPRMNGMECLKFLKNMARLSQCKIFMYSTTSDSTILNESKQLGAAGFIIKPTRTAELTETLSQIFEIPALT